MAHQYPGPPPEQPPGGPGQNPYAAPDGGRPAEAGYGYPQGGLPGEPGYGYPQAAPPPPVFAPGTPPPPPVGPPIQPPQAMGLALALGDIAVNGDTIVTPAGPMPLKGAVWTATDMSRTEERMPTHAVVLAIVFFFFCLLGLLFLLMKERITTGFVQVTVNSGGRHHSTMVPVQSREQVMFVLNQVNYARSLSV
ncbi:hypothetical protein [Streptomyces noursei]|uniref:hypothetical protein n=1 Tax=Streptomyces noursei TaxID=1971 RepID=UPI0016781E24|nr:hypothetical protein [Streptomyces noursei]MCZ1017168.1 hypothetical protein [Streptomyces noursei]GGX11192.1 hypothetical protein GCM10010341_35910 [Streptomyces noursei]